MIMNYRKYIIAIAALTLAWGCSSDDDDEKKDNEPVYANSTFMSYDQIPLWEVDQSADQQRPQWTSPDPSRFENKMIVLVRLQNELVPYSTDDDMMAVLVDNECRALSIRSGNDEKVFFVLNVHGNADDVSEKFQLCYYSGGLKQLFVLNAPKNTYLNERTVGIDSDFSPDFTDGSSKYPVKTMLTVYPGLLNNRPVSSEHDLVGVFVNGECRGIGLPGQAFTAFAYNKDEQAELRYFSWLVQGIFTTNKKITLTGEPQTVTFEY